MISLRIPLNLEKKLNSLARAAGRSRSDIIKESILEYIHKHEQKLTPYELGKELFGKASSDKTDLAINRKKYLRQMLEEKNESRKRID